MIDKLVVNGCSYMSMYAEGQGHQDLAARLSMAESQSIAKPSSSNSRIIRTTLKHSYQSTTPSLYVVGLTFLDREELPIGKDREEFEGRWISIQNGFLDQNFENTWTQQDCDHHLAIKVKIRMIDNVLDRVENLMYQILSMIRDLESRGHKTLVFAQVADEFRPLVDHPRLQLLKSCMNIVDGLAWGANAWQVAQGAKTAHDANVPHQMQHIFPGEYRYINQFLKNYIQTHGLLK